MLNNLIDKDRVILISPFKNFNIVLGLNIVNLLLQLTHREIAVVIPYTISSNLVKEVIKNGENVIFFNNFRCLNKFYAYIIIFDRIEDSTLLHCFLDVDKVFIIVERILQIYKLKNTIWRIFRVRRVDPNTYSLLDIHGDIPIILTIKDYSIYQSKIPDDVMLIYREVVNHLKEFGSIKASTLLKYMIKNLGYDRDFILNAIRKSIAIGIIKYQSGYLIPVILINT